MLYDLIKDKAKEKGLSIAELERQMDFANGTIRKWDNAEASFFRVVKVAFYLGIPFDELIDKKRVKGAGRHGKNNTTN